MTEDDKREYQKNKGGGKDEWMWEKVNRNHINLLQNIICLIRKHVEQDNGQKNLYSHAHGEQYISPFAFTFKQVINHWACTIGYILMYIDDTDGIIVMGGYFSCILLPVRTKSEKPLNRISSVLSRHLALTSSSLAIFISFPSHSSTFNSIFFVIPNANVYSNY